jgi:hypothetical protein
MFGSFLASSVLLTTARIVARFLIVDHLVVCPFALATSALAVSVDALTTHIAIVSTLIKISEQGQLCLVDL